jgi:hypothetical protein
MWTKLWLHGPQAATAVASRTGSDAAEAAAIDAAALTKALLLG